MEKVFLTRKEYDMAIDLGFGRYFRDRRGNWSLGGVVYELPATVALELRVKVCGLGK